MVTRLLGRIICEARRILRFRQWHRWSVRGAAANSMLCLRCGVVHQIKRRKAKEAKSESV